MTMPLDYDDSRLQQLFAELEPKRRLQALKGGIRREAAEVRKTAVNNLRKSGLSTNSRLEKGVRSIVFRRKAGFRVTVGTKRANKNGKGEAGFYRNRWGLKKPVLLWAETGVPAKGSESKVRKTKAKYSIRRMARLRASHSTGRMKKYGFMEQTLADVRGTVTDDIHRLVIENVERVAKRYGCK